MLEELLTLAGAQSPLRMANGPCAGTRAQVQQLGRTHRSNQRQPPRYIILHTDVAGEHRFASAVAKRLEQLGALTHGDRHASCQDALSSFNLDDKCVPLIRSQMTSWQH